MSHKRTLKVEVLAVLAAVAVLTVGVVPTVFGQLPAGELRNAALADPKAQAIILDSYGNLPLGFEANHGQADGRVKFLSRTGGYTLFLTQDEAVLALRGSKANLTRTKFAGGDPTPQSGAGVPPTSAVLRMKLRNANPVAKITGMEDLAGTSNYFIGNDPASWRTNVPTYAKVKYEGIYSGIDLVYYGNQRQLEYDFIVAPGADPHHIAFDVRGAKRIRRDERGDLVLNMKTGEEEIRWHKPVVYQEKNGTRQFVAARYAITDTNRVGFEVAKYDASKPLYIDPLIYSTYLGGSSSDWGYAIAVDSTGNAYVTGSTASIDFPTKNPLQAANGGQDDAFVAKINPTGSAVVYSTYLGGNSSYGGSDVGSGIAVDSAGNAYVTGYTQSTDFPTTIGSFQTTCGDSGCPDGDGFVAKINPTGSALVYSTYLGGSASDWGSAIAVDSAGHAYVTGSTQSTDFPTTPGAFQTVCGGNCLGGDAFVTKLNPTGSALVYSTYLGGSGYESEGRIAVDSAGNAYVSGSTSSADFPTKNPLQANFGGGELDAFVTKLNPTGSALVYSTYLGGSGYESGSGIAVDSAGHAYVTGGTASADFPKKNPLQANYGGNLDGFVAKINVAGSALVYSTYLGGSGEDDLVGGIAVDSGGNAYVTGNTGSTNFPTTPGALKTTCSRCPIDENAFVAKINPTGSALVYSTYLGGSGRADGTGIAVDRSGNAYVTGYTSSTGFPTKNPLQPVFGGGPYDAFVVKMDVRAVPTITLLSSLNPSIYGQAVTFTAELTSTIGAPPNGETITFMKGITVLGTGVLSGGSASFTTSTLPAATNNITAVYGGDVNFTGGKSKVVQQVVSKATTTTTLTSSLNPSNFGQSVTFTAIVTGEFGGLPQSSVTFYDGTTALGTVSMSGGKAEFTTSKLATGTHNITATFKGGTNFTASSGSLTQTVN